MKLHIEKKMKNQRIFKQSALYKGLYSFAILLLLFTSCKKDETEQVKVPLAVTDYYPNSGNQGTLVTIEGTGFSSSINEISATFSGTRADVVSATSTAIVLRAPSGGASGDIVMKMNEESVTVGKYTYQDLTVTQISPANGAAGTHIRISGAGFGSLQGPAEVYINGTKAVVVSASDTLLVAEVPAAAGSGPVTVKVNGKEASGQAFKFQSITAIKPLTGGKGTRVRITGSGFEALAAGNFVDFNGKEALVEEAAEDHLIVIAPDGVGTGPLSVTTNDQKVTGPVFTVVAVPVILSVTPLSGPAGTEMTIAGTTFSTLADENKVTINGVNVAITAASATKITLQIPGGTGSGKILLRVNDQLAEGPDFKDQTLGIARLSPESGLEGTSVTITGTGFSTNASQNVVTFNGTVASVVSASATSLVVVAPAGFTSGPLKVTVNGITANAPADFNRAGVVTLAGGPGNSDITLDAFRNGSVVVDGSGNVFILEMSKNRVKKITPQGIVSIFAGSTAGLAGNVNGTGSAALFRLTTNSGLAIDAQGNLFIGDTGNQVVRKVTPQGMVTTYSINLGNVGRLSIDEDGILYAIYGFTSVWKIEKDGTRTSINGNGMDEAVRPAIFGGTYYSVSNESVFIGSTNITSQQRLNAWVGANYGYADGVGTNAMFTAINSLASDGKGNIYVADNANLAIRKVNTSTREVTTVAKFTNGYKDGSLNEAQFKMIGDIAIDKDGNLYVLDVTNNAIRKIFLK